MRRWFRPEPHISRKLIYLLASSFLVAELVGQTQAPVYDVVIRNGRVLDGSGNPWIAADVAIKDGRFVAIGRVMHRGRLELDASGNTSRRNTQDDLLAGNAAATLVTWFDKGGLLGGCGGLRLSETSRSGHLPGASAFSSRN